MPTLDDGMLSLMRDVQSGEDTDYYAPRGEGEPAGEEGPGPDAEAAGGLSSYLAAF
jgi:hypothetical protein